jgi:hypothetical protein
LEPGWQSSGSSTTSQLITLAGLDKRWDVRHHQKRSPVLLR